MVKAIFWITVLVVVGVFIKDGVLPLYNANQETKKILKNAGINIHRKVASREKAIAALKANCQYGVINSNRYEFRCSSNSAFSFMQ